MSIPRVEALPGSKASVNADEPSPTVSGIALEPMTMHEVLHCTDRCIELDAPGEPMSLATFARIRFMMGSRTWLYR
jgi:hypothetical protein